MAMGGHHTKGNGGHRGKPYGLMLLLVFGAALLGVTTLHKFKERRIFNQLLKDKDRELYSLNLLLQKERDRGKEMKEKTEEMKSKIYTLRSKKLELDNRVLEMQSTINSLKEEHRTMATALEEKQEEVKILRDKEIDSGKREESQESSLVEILKQKDSEIDDLKRRLESQVKVWSVSSDDPSNKETNATKTNLNESQDNAVEEKNEAKVGDESGVVSEAKDVDDDKAAVDAEGRVDEAKLEESGKSESIENSDGGGGVGSMSRGRKKGKKLRRLSRKKMSERTRSSADLKSEPANEERSNEIVIKPIYESDLGNGKEIEGGNGLSNDEAKKEDEIKAVEVKSKSADSEELQTEIKNTNGESADSEEEFQTEIKNTNGESAYSEEQLQTEIKNTNGESADSEELQTEKSMIGELAEVEDKEDLDEADF